MNVGHQEPVPSPNREVVAFFKAWNIWSTDVATGHEEQITTDGKPFEAPYASVNVWITTWSPDSSRLLYDVTAGVWGCSGDDPSGEECPEYQEREVEYGYFDYDLRSRSRTRVKLPERQWSLAGWMQGGEFIGTGGLPPFTKNGELLRFSVGAERPLPATTVRGDFGQVGLDLTGRWATASLAQCVEGEGCVHIVKVNLATGAVSTVSPPCSWAECQWPTFSPSGEKIAWIHRWDGPDKKGEIKQELILDGHQVYRCDGKIYFDLVSDSVVAVACRNELIVLDTQTRKEIAHHDLSEAAEK